MGWKTWKRGDSLNSLKRLIYLISPNKIYKKFYSDLEKVLKFKNVKFFQLRLKKTPNAKIIKISKKIRIITLKYNVKFIINDDPLLARKIVADGCHLGQKDMNINDARKLLKKKIIGVTCHNSLKLADLAIKDNADYIAFGAFNSSKTKRVKYRANMQLIKKFKKSSNIPVIAIGGINNLNYKKLLLNKADFLAISGYIWKNNKLKPLEAINKFKWK